MSADSTPPFSSVAIVGLGLIGGSVALGLRHRWPDLPVIGVDRPDVLEQAERRGAITRARLRLEDLGDAGLVVLAAPVLEITQLLGEAGRARLQGPLTDVGSTKRHIMATADATGLRFVGGHPVAGAASAGLPSARPDLFEGREWLIVPGRAPEEDVRGLERLVRGLGALPRRMDADRHDRLMAYVSHLPQLLATMLMTTAASAVGEQGLAAAGPGFADMTRLASSPFEIWRGILATNADYVAEALGALAATLPLADGKLADPGRLEAMFRGANEWSERT